MQDSIDQFLQVAHSIIPSLEDFGTAPFTLLEEPEFVDNEEAAKRSYPDDPPARFKELQNLGKIGTLTVDYSMFPFYLLSFHVSGYQTEGGADKSFQGLKIEQPSGAIHLLDIEQDLGDDQIGWELNHTGEELEARNFLVRFRRGQFINTVIMIFSLPISPKQALQNAMSFARLMDMRAAQLIKGADVLPTKKPLWILPNAIALAADIVRKHTKNSQQHFRHPAIYNPEAKRTGTMSNPITLAAATNLVKDGTKHFDISVPEAHRGEEAWSRLFAADKYSAPPHENMEYVLLYVQVDYLKGPEDELLKLSRTDFRIVSKKQVLDPASVRVPHPSFKIAFFPGASGGGWMAWQVYIDDSNPLLVMGMDRKGRGGFYFSIQS